MCDLSFRWKQSKIVYAIKSRKRKKMINVWRFPFSVQFCFRYTQQNALFRIKAIRRFFMLLFVFRFWSQYTQTIHMSYGIECTASGIVFDTLCVMLSRLLTCLVLLECASNGAQLQMRVYKMYIELLSYSLYLAFRWAFDVYATHKTIDALLFCTPRKWHIRWKHLYLQSISFYLLMLETGWFFNLHRWTIECATKLFDTQNWTSVLMVNTKWNAIIKTNNRKFP